MSFTRVRVTLRTPAPENRLVLQTETDFSSDATELPLTLSVPLPQDTPASGLPLRLTLEYLNASNTIVFTGGPVGVTAVPVAPGQKPPPPAQVTIPITYTGPGANATEVVFTVAPSSVNTGGAFTFVAVARDQAGAPIPGVPILYNSLDPALASINVATGAGTAGTTRGTVGIQAQLLTRQSVTAQLAIKSPVASISRVGSGATRSGTVGSPLPEAVVVKVLAADGRPPEPGVTVTFAATHGGAAVPPTAVTDPVTGEASTTWRLGSTAAEQSLTATVAELPGASVVYTANARPIAPVQVVFDQQPPASATAGVPLAPAVTVKAVDANGTLATGFAEQVSLTLAPGAPSGGAITGTASVQAQGGIATFSNLAFTRPGTYTLVANAGALGEGTSSSFTVVAGPARRLAFGTYPAGGARAGAQLGPITVIARDAFNNPATSFTGSVTLSAIGPSAVGAATETGVEGVTRVTGAPGANAAAEHVLAAVNARDGVATFPDITLTAAGGYVLAATVGTIDITPVTGQSLVITPGTATTLELISGGGQSAIGGAALANPITVQVTDAHGNGVPGIMVNFAPVAGNGSVNPVSPLTDAGGFARTVWTVAGAAGTKTLNVTSAGLTPNLLPVHATATTGSGMARTWTGAVSSDFTVAGNWSPAGAPGSADDLTIPSTGTSPVINAPITVGSLNVMGTLTNNSTLTVAGSIVSAGYLSVRGSATVAAAPARIIVGTGAVILTGPSGSTINGYFDSPVRIVGGDYTATGSITFYNGFKVESNGKFAVGANSVTVYGIFETASGGRLDMNSATGTLNLEEDAIFGGSSPAGSLTAGTLIVKDDFTATGSSFNASGTHLTRFAGNEESDQLIAFTSPIAGSGFNHVVFESYDPKIFSGAPTILGNVEILSGSGSITGDGVTVRIGGSLTDYTFEPYDTQGAWRVSTTDFFGSGTINSQYLTTDIIISGGTRQMAPYSCAMCDVRMNSSRGLPRSGAPSSARVGLQAGIADAGYAQITGSILITGASSVLNLNGTELYVGGYLATASGGKLKMTNEDDYLYVENDVTFGGGSTAGLLTAGELEVIGSFTQGGGAADAFAPTADFYTYIGDEYCYYCGVRAPNARAARPKGTVSREMSAADQAAVMRHNANAMRFEALRAPMRARREARAARRTAALAARQVRATPLGRQGVRPARSRASILDARRVGGTASEVDPSSITFANPGSSAFRHLYLQGNYYELGSDVNVLGRLETGGGYNFYVSSSTPRAITSRGADVRELYFSNIRWVLLDGDDVLALDNVEFSDMDPTVDQFTVSRAGTEFGESVIGYTLWYWYFGTTPTTGRYINANDSDGAVPFVQLNMYSPTPATHGGRIVTSGGALINNWAASFVWTGTGGDNLWGTYGNWSTGFPPGSNDDITIPAGTPFDPRVNSYGYARNLTIASVVVIQVDGTLSVYGDLTAPTGSAATSGGGALRMEGCGCGTRSVSGRFAKLDVVYNAFKIADGGNQLIVDNAFVVGGAAFDINGGQGHVGGPNGAGAGTLSIINGGTLTMTNSADRLYVGSGGAFWSGASSVGKLTAGILTMVGGHLTQASGATDAFAPSGTFSTIWTGSNHVTFASPGPSFFNDLTVTAGSTLELYTNALVQGTLTRGSGAADAAITASYDFTLTVRGLNIAGANLTRFSRVHLRFEDGQPGALFSNVKFEGFPASHTGIFFDVARSTGSLAFSGLDFSGQTLGAAGRFVRNSGGANVTITGSSPATGTLNVNFDKTGAGGITWP